MTAPFDANWLFAAVLLTTPILYAALGELISQRTGVFNVGLEGMMLFGAFFAYIVRWLTDNIALGLLSGVSAGALLATVMAVLSVQVRANQIIVGVGLNIVALGITGFLVNVFFPVETPPTLQRPGIVSVPVLSELPVVGGALFKHKLLVYVAYLAVPLVWILLFRMRFGLSARAAGEAPPAVDTAGISVAKVRWTGIIAAGAFAGLGGAFLSVGELGLFGKNMTGGRGFLALAAVIFGRWRPVGVLGACLVFGAADALQLRLQAERAIPRQVWFVAGLIAAAYLIRLLSQRGRSKNVVRQYAVGASLLGVAAMLFVISPDWSFPSQLWLSLPFILTLLALGGFVGRTRAPAAWGVPYDRQSI